MTKKHLLSPIIILIAEGIREKINSRHKACPIVAEQDAKANSAGEKSVFRKTIIPAVGALISLTGVALVAGVSFSLSGTALGYVYMAGACFSWVSYCFLTRPLFARRSRI